MPQNKRDKLNNTAHNSDNSAVIDEYESDKDEDGVDEPEIFDVSEDNEDEYDGERQYTPPVESNNSNKFLILCNNNKWKSMSSEQEHIISLASVVEKLKYDHLNIAKNFKTLPPRKGKGIVKGKGKGKIQNYTSKKSQHGKWK